jgi:rfaE bifunctional protein kinase chain/domain
MASGPDLEKLVYELKGARVLVMGDLMLDTYLIGEAGRISPEAPVPVVKLGTKDYRLGGAANSAMNIAALGGEPVLVGAIGRDESAAMFLDIAHRMGFRTEGIISDSSILTTSKVRVVAGNQQIVRIDDERRLEWTDEIRGKILGFIEKTIPEVEVVAVSDYAKGFIDAEVMTRIHDLSRMNRIPVLVDPKPPNIGLYKGSDLLKPNRKEAAELAGMDIKDDETCDKAAEKLMAEYSPRALLITRGPDGMHLYREGMDPVRVKARVSHVYDVSGAGDTVLATLSMGYAKGFDPVDSCRLAAAAAAVAVTKPGTSTVSHEELVESVRSFAP